MRVSESGTVNSADGQSSFGGGVHASEKQLNEINRLGDMLHFPAAVNAGATANVLLTVALTWWVEARYPLLPGVWVALVLLVNLMPVVVLRMGMGPGTVYPKLGQMDFVRDQHKFSDWVYVGASANMAFWILLTWTVAALRHTSGVLVAVELTAFVATFSPVLFRGLLQPGKL